MQKCRAIFFTGTAILVVIRIVKERPAVLFLILCSIDLTERLIGGILGKEEVPEHRVISTFLAKSRPTFLTHRAALFFTLFYRVGRRVLL